MNKLEGFLFLKSVSVPTVEWKLFTKDTLLSDEEIWTVRCAVDQGDDLNLPRVVGVSGGEATEFGRRQLFLLGERGIVIYYPSFDASVSGTVCINDQNITIECVLGDLWHLVTEGKLDYGGVFSCGSDVIKEYGNTVFLSDEQKTELLKYANRLKSSFRDEISSGESVMAEWSYKPDGKIVFYELRTIK